MKAEEQMQMAVANIINKAASGIDGATAFIIEETPEVVQQMLTWYTVKSTILFVIGSLMIILIVPIWKKVVIPFANKMDDGRGGFGLSMMGSGLLMLIYFTISASLINFQWLQIMIAPKVWLIEYASKLIS